MRFKNIVLFLLSAIMIVNLFSCATIPKGAKAIQNFEPDRYLGKWYEIARLDFKFEKNLNNTTAEYTSNPNGTIKVDNKGFNTQKKEWKQSIGKAKFVKENTTAMLKVSFFGPFYGGYNVIALDSDYNYALVAGSSLKYLWILSRTKTIPEDVKDTYLKLAKSIGYKTSDLLWIEHKK